MSTVSISSSSPAPQKARDPWAPAYSEEGNLLDMELTTQEGCTIIGELYGRRMRLTRGSLGAWRSDREINNRWHHSSTDIRIIEILSKRGSYDRGELSGAAIGPES